MPARVARRGSDSPLPGGCRSRPASSPVPRLRADVGVAVHHHSDWGIVWAGLAEAPGIYNQGSAGVSGELALYDEYAGDVTYADLAEPRRTGAPGRTSPLRQSRCAASNPRFSLGRDPLRSRGCRRCLTPSQEHPSTSTRRATGASPCPTRTGPPERRASTRSTCQSRRRPDEHLRAGRRGGDHLLGATRPRRRSGGAPAAVIPTSTRSSEPSPYQVEAEASCAARSGAGARVQPCQ